MGQPVISSEDRARRVRRSREWIFLQSVARVSPMMRNGTQSKHGEGTPVMPEPLTARRGLLAGATVVFGVFLCLIFLRMSSDTDAYMYHLYARTARTEGLASLYRTYWVEYPPLAVGLMLAAEELGDRLTVPSLLTRYNVYKNPNATFLRFKLAYRLLLAGWTLAAWGLFLILLRRVFGQESVGEWTERMLAFALGLWPLGYFLLDRLDMALSSLILLAVALLLGRQRSLWSLAALAAAIAFKFVPIALVPVWLAVTAPDSFRRPGRLLAHVLSQGAVLAGFLLLFAAPSWLLAGDRSLSFLTFHRVRGIEFQSNYAAVLTLLRHGGYPVQTVPGIGSVELHCSAAPFVGGLAVALIGAGLLLGAVELLRARTRRPVGAGQTDDRLILGHVFGALLVFVLFNKVFSAQYLLWLVPLAALVPLRGTRRRLFQLGFLGVAYLTLSICQPQHFADLLGQPLPTTPPSLTGASPFGTGLLLLRFLLLAALTGLLAVDLFHRARPPQTISAGLSQEPPSTDRGHAA